jgi:hypothetical protein
MRYKLVTSRILDWEYINKPVKSSVAT